MKFYVLDANALLDYSENGPGGPTVERIIGEAARRQASLAVSVVNWGEVFYCLWNMRGEATARKTLTSLSHLPVELVSVELAQAIKAAELKALHKIPYADCIAAALALNRRATLVTADRDFEKLGHHFPILWLSRP